MMRNYRIISRQNNFAAWGGGLSQRRPKYIKVTEKLPRFHETLSIVLKGSFVFDGTLFNYFDQLIIKVSSATDKKMVISENIIVSDIFGISHGSARNIVQDNLGTATDTLTITKEV